MLFKHNMFCQYFDINGKLVNINRGLAEFELAGAYIIGKTTQRLLEG
jgi:hypothetical protein